jgi:serine phosphatase RsbU (regulator of sigma subunit)
MQREESKKKESVRLSTKIVILAVALVIVFGAVLIVLTSQIGGSFTEILNDTFTENDSPELKSQLSGAFTRRLTNQLTNMTFIAAGIILLYIIIMLVYTRILCDRPLVELIEFSNRILLGDFSKQVEVKSLNNMGRLFAHFNEMQSILNKMLGEIRSGIHNASKGMLNRRLDVRGYKGNWGKIIVEFNALMDAVVVPIDDMTFALLQVADGHLDTRITKDDYEGYFSILKDTVNSAVEGINRHLNDKIESERIAHDADLARGKAEAVSEAMLSSIHYASKIQRNLLPKLSVFDNAFSDYSIIWEPRDIVGGDIYWIKNFEEGTVLCVCDCTGHGTPGALLTMLVVSAFEDIVNETNYKDTANVVWMLEQRLVSAFNVDTAVSKTAMLDIKDGCDMAAIYISKDGEVSVSAGNTSVFACNGKEVTRYKGQKIYVGEGEIKTKQDIKVTVIPKDPDNKFYIASDGLFDQIGGVPARPFGYERFTKVLLANHDKKLTHISDAVWETFESYRGEQLRRDDVELISFKP